MGCCVRRRFVMVRRGWTKVEVGWLQLIRGPGSRCKAGNVDEVPTNHPRWRTMEEPAPMQVSPTATSVESTGSRGAGDSSRARGFFATCPGGSEEALCGTAIFSLTRFRRGSSTRESCQVGESFGGPRGHFRSRGRCCQERVRQGTSCGTRQASGRADFGMQGLCRTSRETAAQVGSRKSCRNRFIGARPSTATTTDSRCRVGSGSFPSSMAQAIFLKHHTACACGEFLVLFCTDSQSFASQ